MASNHELAQLNVARAVAPLDAPELAGFVAQLGEINALAERSPGFRWRLQDDSGNATNIHVGDDPRVIVNLTVWNTIDDLYEFTYRTDHKRVFARRFEWFERWDGPSTVLWWQAAGTIPSLDEAFRRLALLAELGPTEAAFTFKQPFAQPS